MLALRVFAFVAGAAVVLATVLSAVKTFVLPRAAPTRLTRIAFLIVRTILLLRARPSKPYELRDRVMAFYAPLSLLATPAVWLIVLWVAFAAMIWGLEGHGAQAAIETSGSSLLTLGYLRPHGGSGYLVSYVEAALGLGLLALLIAYMPSIYAAFARRETAVALMEPLAGNPPDPAALLIRHHRISGLDKLEEIWVSWKSWFADIEESHTSIAALVFFRSPQPYRSWVTSAGCVLDSASLRVACLELPRSPDAELCIRAGYIALRRISDFFNIRYDPDPAPMAPISIGRREFDDVWQQFIEADLPVKEDRDQAWRDYAGWRVNYDTVLLALAGLTLAPPAMWSSDRAMAYRRPPLARVGFRHR